MALRLMGEAPAFGQPDRRYYLIDVQVLGRRIRLSSGTREKDVANRRQQDVVNAVNKNPAITDETLRAIVRGDATAARIAARHASGLTLKEAYDKAMRHPKVWGDGNIRRPDAVEADFNVLLRVFGEDTPVKAITKETIDDAATRMLRGEGEAPGRKRRPRTRSTVNHKLAKLSRLLHACKDCFNALDTVPKIELYKNADRRREIAFEVDEEDAILEALLKLDEPAAPGAPGSWNRKYDAHRYHKLFIVMAETGLRPGEAYPLPWSDINLEARTLRLWETDALKTGASVRSIPLTQRCVDALESPSCKEGERGPFDGMDINRGQRLWKKACQSIGLTHRDAVPYALRHTAGTRIQSAMGDLRLTQHWLGHSNSKMTERYVKVVNPRMREAASKLEGMRS